MSALRLENNKMSFSVWDRRKIVMHHFIVIGSNCIAEIWRHPNFDHIRLIVYVF